MWWYGASGGGTGWCTGGRYPGYGVWQGGSISRAPPWYGSGYHSTTVSPTVTTTVSPTVTTVSPL